MEVQGQGARDTPCGACMYTCCLLIDMDQLTQPSPVPRVRGPPPAAREVRSMNATKLRFHCRYGDFELPGSIIDYECSPYSEVYHGQPEPVSVIVLNILNCYDGVVCRWYPFLIRCFGSLVLIAYCISPLHATETWSNNARSHLFSISSRV